METACRTDAQDSKARDDAEWAIRQRPLPEIEAMLARLRLPEALISVARGQESATLRHGFLLFGKVFSVKMDLVANHGGTLKRGARVRALGAHTDPTDLRTRVYFEPEDRPGETICLVFDPDLPAKSGRLRGIHDRNTLDFFDPMGAGADRRRYAELSQAKRVLWCAREDTKRQIAALYPKESPAYQVAFEALVVAERLYRSAARAYVLGSGDGVEGVLDYGGLRFGHPYRVRSDVAGDHTGALDAGRKVMFLGAEIHGRHETVLRFECIHRAAASLVIHHNDDTDPARPVPPRDLSAVFEEIPVGIYARAIQLTNLRATLEDLRQLREA